MFLHSKDRSIYRSALVSALALVCAVAGAQAILPSAMPKNQAIPLTPQKAHKPDAKESKSLLRRRSDAMRGFIENKGQWPEGVFFAGRSAGMDLWVTKTGLRIDEYADTSSGGKGHVIGVKFLGAKPISARGFEATNMLTDFIGYKHEARSAKTFATIKSSNLYPGVTLKNYFDGSQPRYDLVLAPKANPSSIKMSYQATGGVIVSKDKLSIKTSVGDIIENKLMAYQMVNGAKKPVKVAFKTLGKDTVGFSVGAYDHSKSLTIDPLIYGTYYGGDSGQDEVHGVVADLVGGVYMTGSTRSLDFPVIFGPYTFTLNNGNDPYFNDDLKNLNGRDGFVSKLQGDAYVHNYAAFLGGSRDDTGEFLQLDQFGDLWVAGYTSSADFPGQTEPNVQYLNYDPQNSQGHTSAGGVFFNGPGGGLAGGNSGPSGNGYFELGFPGGAFTSRIPWNASPATVQAAIQAILPGGSTVTVTDPHNLNDITKDYQQFSDGYKISFSPDITQQMVVDSTHLQAIYISSRENSTRAQLITVDKAANPPQPATKGAYSLTIPGVGTTAPVAFNATAPVVQAALSAIAPGVQVKPSNQAFTGTLPGNSYIVLFKTNEPVMSLNSVGANQQWLVDVSGSTGGTFTLTPNGAGTTAPIPFNATAPQVQAALAAVVGVGNVTVTSSTPQVYVVTFTGALGFQVVTLVGTFGTTGGVNTVTLLMTGSGGIDFPYIIVPLTLDDMFWDQANSSIPVGGDPGFQGIMPAPNPNGGAFNIGSSGNVYSTKDGFWNSNAKLLHDSIATNANIGDTMVVIPNDPTKGSMPLGSMAVVYSNDNYVFGSPIGNILPVPPTNITNNLVTTGNVVGPQTPPFTVVSEGRISPTPVYKAHSEYKCFVMRFKQDPNTVLNPSPTKSFFFGGQVAPVLTGFRIIPHDNPVAGEPIRLTFGGTCFGGFELLPEVPGLPRDPGADVGFILRINYSDAGGFSVVPQATQYVDAFDDSTGEAYNIFLNGIDVDPNGNVYTGGTIRGDFGTTVDTSLTNSNGHFIFQTTPVDPAGTLNNGRLLRDWDGFARKYSATGSLTYSVLVGGTGKDEGWGIAVDPNGDAYLVGRSTSFDYPRTHGAFNEVFTQDLQSTLVKLNPAATDVIYSTGLRTGATVTPVGVAVDARGTAFITFIISRVTVFHADTPTNDPNMDDGFLYQGSIPTGSSDPNDPPLITAYNTGTEGGGEYGSTDGALMVINPSGTTLLYGTYLGSSLDDIVYRPYVDSGGDCWVFGWTDTLRDYVRLPKFTRNVRVMQVVTTLPGSMITPLAFRPTPDPETNKEGPGDQLSPAQLYNTQENFDPYFLDSIRQRDGWVGRFRIGLPSVASVTFNPTTIPGGLGQASTGVVTLSLPAPAGGAFISLTMSASAAASFDPSSQVTQSSIVIPAGQKTGAFTIYSNPVTDNTPVDVTATFEGNFHVGRVVVTPWLQSMTINPPAVVGGNSVAALLTLAAPAGSGGINVTLGSDNTTVVPLTGVNGFVPAGQKSAAVQIGTNGVDQDTTVTLNASLLGVGKAFQLVVHPAQLKSLTFAPNPVTSGSSATGTLVLNGKAGPLGFTVNLAIQGSPPGYTITPSTLTFKGGQTSQTFTVSTPYETQTVPRVVIATMQPAEGYTPNSVSGSLNVVADGITTLAITPSTVSGGTTATGQVTISTPALAGGAKVDLLVSPANGIVSVPSQILVPAGQTTATFSIPTTTLITTTTFQITASRGGSSASASLTVTGLTFTVSVPSIIAPSSNAIGTVTLSGPAPAGGIAVHLSSSVPAVLAVPNTLVIAAGSTSANFPITTFGITTNTAVTISATIGSVTHTVGTTVQASKLMGMTLNPSYCLNLTTTKCSLVLSGPAPVGGMVIHLTNSNPLIASVPATVTIPAGATSYSFSVITLRVTRTLQTTIQGSGPNGGAAAATLTVHN